MPKINIDELCAPIEVTVGGKEYLLADISRETAREMAKLGGEADEIQDAISDTKDLIESARNADNLGEIVGLRKSIAELVKKANNTDSTENLVVIMTKVLNAEKGDIAKLGMRKLTMLVKNIMETVGGELEAKNVPEVAAVKKP